MSVMILNHVPYCSINCVPRAKLLLLHISSSGNKSAAFCFRSIRYRYSTHRVGEKFGITNHKLQFEKRDETLNYPSARIRCTLTTFQKWSNIVTVLGIANQPENKRQWPNLFLLNDWNWLNSENIEELINPLKILSLQTHREFQYCVSTRKHNW